MKPQQDIRLEIQRVIHAPRARIYAAWTDPAQLKEWFGPEGAQTRDLVAEPHIGGKFRWDLTNSAGEEITVQGEYRELQPNKKIVFTWHNPGDADWKEHVSLVTVELADRDGGTEVRLTHVQLPTADSRDRHREGWESVLDELEKFVRE